MIKLKAKISWTKTVHPPERNRTARTDWQGVQGMGKKIKSHFLPQKNRFSSQIH
jgi:hypothetical protein